MGCYISRTFHSLGNGNSQNDQFPEISGKSRKFLGKSPDFPMPFNGNGNMTINPGDLQGWKFPGGNPKILHKWLSNTVHISKNEYHNTQMKTYLASNSMFWHIADSSLRSKCTFSQLKIRLVKILKPLISASA